VSYAIVLLYFDLQLMETSRVEIERRALLTLGVAGALSGCESLGIGNPFQPQSAPVVPALDEVRLHTDFGYLQYYRAANAALRAQPQGARRVVFFGDSITQNWTEFDPAFFTGTGYVGRGISGQTTPQMLVRFRDDVLSLSPLAVHILAGTNDIAENTGPYFPEDVQNNLTSMAELARLQGVKVILATITPAADYYWRPGLMPVPKIAALNAWIRTFAAEQKIVLADYAAVLDDGKGGMKPGLSSDGVHPSKTGYALMEEVARAAIEGALA